MTSYAFIRFFNEENMNLTIKCKYENNGSLMDDKIKSAGMAIFVRNNFIFLSVGEIRPSFRPQTPPTHK